MSARDNILARIREAQGRSGRAPTEAEIARARERIARRESGPQPSIARPADPVARFLAECDRLGTTHAHAADLAAVPAEVARYLAATALERRVALWPELAGLDWAAAGVEAEER
ncbi:MAG TPA: hypothetical protein VFX50_18410, partial [Gemmatimonadales bacterium]|nr:hypothetical protein [Gemmatimonadales bacterium]